MITGEEEELKKLAHQHAVVCYRFFFLQALAQSALINYEAAITPDANNAVASPEQNKQV